MSNYGATFRLKNSLTYWWHWFWCDVPESLGNGKTYYCRDCNEFWGDK